MNEFWLSKGRKSSKRCQTKTLPNCHPAGGSPITLVIFPTIKVMASQDRKRPITRTNKCQMNWTARPNAGNTSRRQTVPGTKLSIRFALIGERRQQKQNAVKTSNMPGPYPFAYHSSSPHRPALADSLPVAAAFSHQCMH